MSIKQIFRYDYIELENFGCFFGKFRIEFDKNKIISVFKGENGSGKTTILKFIYWILFGSSKLQDQFKFMNELIPNKNLKTNLKSAFNKKLFKDDTNTELKCGGQIGIELLDNTNTKTFYEIKKYLILKDKRKLNFELEENVTINNSRILTKKESKIFFQNNKKYIPLPLRKFLFIPAETMGNLLQPRNYKQIRDFSILKSELPLLDKVSNTINSYIEYANRKITREQNRNKELKEVNKEIEKIQTEIEKIKKKINEKNMEKGAAIENFTKIESEIETLFKDQELAFKYKELKSQIENLSNNLLENKLKETKFLKKKAVNFYLMELLKDVNIDIKKRNFPEYIDKKTAKKIVKDYKVHKLLECPICKKKLEDSIEDTLQEYINGVVEFDNSVAFKFKIKLEEQIKNLDDIQTSFKEIREDIPRIERQIEKKKFDRDSLGINNEAKTDEYLKSFELLKKKRDNAERKKKTANNYLIKISNKFDHLEDELNNVLIPKKETIISKKRKLSSKEGKWSETKTRMEIIQRIFKDSVKEKYNNKIKNEIEKFTIEYFKKILDIRGEVDIEIIEQPMPSGEINWIIQFGENLYDLSNGQEQILIICYIFAIFQTLNIRLPLFLDAPFSALDASASLKLIEIIDLAFVEGQVLITSLNKILTKPIRKKLAKNLDNIYNLNIVEDLKQVKIVKES